MTTESATFYDRKAAFEAAKGLDALDKCWVLYFDGFAPDGAGTDLFTVEWSDKPFKVVITESEPEVPV